MVQFLTALIVFLINNDWHSQDAYETLKHITNLYSSSQTPEEAALNAFLHHKTKATNFIDDLASLSKAESTFEKSFGSTDLKTSKEAYQTALTITRLFNDVQHLAPSPIETHHL